MRFLTALLAVGLFVGPPLSAWGRKGHRIVARLALQDLPAGPAAWFQGQEDTVLDHSSDPDEWKNDPQEGPRHFMELDLYGGEVPLRLSDAGQKVGPAVFHKAGQLPWVIQDRVLDLTQAFKSGDRKQVAYLASILSHYVGDLHVPLHTVQNYDGQLTGQKGVHSRWETGLVDRMIGEPDVRPALETPGLIQAPWIWLKETNALVPALLADDRASNPILGGRGGEPESYWLMFGKRQNASVREQLARAGQHTGQLILLAWIQAGRPAAARP